MPTPANSTPVRRLHAVQLFDIITYTYNRMTKNKSSIYMAIAGPGITTAYFLNLLPFARFVNLETEADVRAYLMRIGQCDTVDSMYRSTDQEYWVVTCDIDTKVTGGRFWVFNDGKIQTESEVIGF